MRADARTGRFEDQVDARFAQVDARFDKLEERADTASTAWLEDAGSARGAEGRDGHSLRYAREPLRRLAADDARRLPDGCPRIHRHRWPDRAASPLRLVAGATASQSASRPGRSGGAPTPQLKSSASRSGVSPPGSASAWRTVGADRQPGEDAAEGGEGGADDHRHVEAVGHLRRVVEAVAGEPGDHRQHGDGEQAGDAGDGVVDARRRSPEWRLSAAARTVAVTGATTRVRPSAEDDHRRQDRGDVAVAGFDLGHQQQAERRSPAARR